MGMLLLGRVAHLVKSKGDDTGRVKSSEVGQVVQAKGTGLSVVQRREVMLHLRFIRAGKSSSWLSLYQSAKQGVWLIVAHIA